MTPVEAIAKNPSGTAVFLAEVTLGNRYLYFKLVTGTTYSTPDALAVQGVEIDGVDLTPQPSIAAVEADGGWYNDGANTYFNAGATNIFDFNNHSVQGFYELYFSNVAKNFNGKPYRPGILSLPSLSTKLEKKFSSVAEISGGSMVLNNEDKFLDPYREMQWDAGTTTIKFGWDFSDYTMDYADYQQVANFINSARIYNETSFTLQMLDNKNRLKVKIPTAYYSLTTPENPVDGYSYYVFPSMENAGNGKPVPIAYGQNYGVTPICVDMANKIFQVACHACYSLDEVRLFNSATNTWVVTVPVQIDLNGGTLEPPAGLYFLLGDDWDANQKVSCDFKGRMNPDGSLMVNAADIVADLLTLIGEGPNINAASFAAAHALLDFGTNPGLSPSNNRITALKPVLYINTAVTVIDTINIINAFVASFVYVDANGDWFYVVFDPQSRPNLPHFDDTCLDNWTDETEQILGLSSVTAPYATRVTDGWAQLLTFGIPPNKFIHKQPENTDTENNLPTSDPTDANLWGQRKLVFEGKTSRVFQGTITRSDGLLLRPGSQIHVYWGVTRDSQGRIIDAQFDKVMDVIQVSLNFEAAGSGSGSASTTVYCSNLRGWDDNPGFWTSDTPMIDPSLSHLAGYGTGSADPWNPEWHKLIKNFCRQSFGYWTDDNGCIDPTDPLSVLGSCWV